MDIDTGRAFPPLTSVDVGRGAVAVPDGVDALALALCLDAARRRPEVRSRNQLERLAHIGEIELAANLTVGPSSTLQTIVEVVHPLLPQCGGISAVLFDRTTQLFALSASTVPGQEPGAAATRVRKDRGATRFIVESGHALYVQDTRQDPFTANTMLDESGNHCYIGLPIRAGGTVLGVMYALGGTVGQFDEEDLELLTVVADRAAVVVQAASEYQRVSRLASQHALLTDVSTRLGLSEHPGLLVGEFLEAAAETLGLDAVALLPDRPRPSLETCVRGRRPVGWATEAHPEALMELLAEEIASSHVHVVPMGDGLGGPARLVSLRESEPLHDDDVATLVQLAGLITTSLRRAVATDELRASNESLAQFAHVVSHDLRSPLASIAGLVDVVLVTEGDALSDEGRECAERAVEATHRMAKTMQALLDAAKVRVGDLVRRDTDLHDVVRDVLVDLADPIRVTGASVEVDPLPSAWVDADGARVVIQNLVANALKFTRPHQPPRVRISAVAVPDGLQVLVSDEGTGVPEEHRARVFTMFERGAPTTVAGSGIGLSTVTRIVEAHGGRAWLEANRPHGTVAVVQFPERPVWLADDAT